MKDFGPITHGRTRPARFLGYEVAVLKADHKHDHRGHRSINAAIGLKVPIEVIRAKCTPYLDHGAPIRRTERTVDTAFSIVAQFQAEYLGVAEYYKLAFNRHRLGRLHYVVERSLTVVNTAPPSAHQALGFDDAFRQWIVSGYAFAFGLLGPAAMPLITTNTARTAAPYFCSNCFRGSARWAVMTARSPGASTASPASARTR